MAIDAMTQKYLASIEEERLRELEKNAQRIDEFCEVAARKGVTLVPSEFDYSIHIGLFAKRAGIANEFLRDYRKDKDGLIRFQDLLRDFSRSDVGELKGDHFILLAHPHFRRCFHEMNGYAPHFVLEFWKNCKKFPSASIALDEDRIRIDLDHPQLVELDTWYGAPFVEDVARIPVGLTKIRPPLDLDASMTRFFFANAYSLDILWSQKGSIKTFQAMEFKDESVTLEYDGELVHPVRYLHAEYDLDAAAFRHFDGAIQYLPPDDYTCRRETDFNHNEKNLSQIKARSKKLFKISDLLSVEDFSDICAHFLSGNPLVIEYLKGSYPHHITAAIARYRDNSRA